MKIIVAALLLFMLIFGCIGSETATNNDFVMLKEQYNMTDSFYPDQDLMNSYITDLSLLRSQSNLTLSRVIDVELYSSQSFYYFTKSLQEASQINYGVNLCNNKEYKNTLKYLELAKNYSQKASSALTLVLPTDTYLLKTNQAEIINNFYASENEYKQSLEDLC
ncbi:MAG: hypothetical protein WC915_02505 [archaeon]|jgi:hypothetical protein